MLIHFDTSQQHAARFDQAECCVSPYRARREDGPVRFFVGHTFERIVSRGVDAPRHISVGRFRRADLPPGPDTPCLIPWTLVEIEGGDVVERYEATRQQLQTWEAEGLTTYGVRVRFSGNKSWHIAVPSGMMGNPLGSVMDQLELRRRMLLPLAEHGPLDQGLWDARHLIRMPGSVHERGGRVRVFEAYDVIRMPLGHLLDVPDARTPYSAPHTASLHPAWFGRAVAKTAFFVPDQDDVARSSSGLIERIRDGVAEGGRNDAAFAMSCYLLRRMPYVRMAALELERWNRRNDPPLPERELAGCLQSAQRTLNYALQRTPQGSPARV